MRKKNAILDAKNCEDFAEVSLDFDNIFDNISEVGLEEPEGNGEFPRKYVAVGPGWLVEAALAQRGASRFRSQGALKKLPGNL